MPYKIALLVLVSIKSLQALPQSSLEALVKNVEEQSTKEAIRAQAAALYNSSLLLGKKTVSAAAEFLKTLPAANKEEANKILETEGVSKAPLSSSSCSKNICKVSSTPFVKEEPNLLIFISFSMADATLKQLHKEAQKIGARLLMRGLYHNSFRKAQEKIRSLGIIVDIDPVLFEKFQIQQVPSFVLLNPPLLPTNADTVPSFDILRGNVTLGYVLEKFTEEASQESKAIARRLLARLKEGAL